jgi:hypothetical protein
MGAESTSYNAAQFIESWKWVWGRVACLPNFQSDLAGRVFVDILNEPDSQRQGWQAMDGKAGAARRPAPNPLRAALSNRAVQAPAPAVSARTLDSRVWFAPKRNTNPT